MRRAAAVLLLLGAAALAPAVADDRLRGAALYEARCGGCHAVDHDRIGPRHAGVVGRRAGSVAGFDYSPALAASRLVWTPALLERWLADPESVIPGQRMGYMLGDAAQRAEIVAFLQALAVAARR